MTLLNQKTLNNGFYIGVNFIPYLANFSRQAWSTIMICVGSFGISMDIDAPFRVPKFLKNLSMFWDLLCSSILYPNVRLCWAVCSDHRCLFEYLPSQSMCSCPIQPLNLLTTISTVSVCLQTVICSKS